MLEVAVLLVMVVVTMLYSMEVKDDLPLMRMWSVVGFAWLCILFGMVLIDYLTRGSFPMWTMVSKGRGPLAAPRTEQASLAPARRG